MDKHLLLQRYHDGECDAEEARTIHNMLKFDKEMSQDLKFLNKCDSIFDIKKTKTDPIFYSKKIISSIKTKPKEVISVSLGEVIVAMSLAVIILLCYSLVGAQSDLFPLVLISYLSVLGGGVLFLSTRHLKNLENKIQSSILRKRLPISIGDVVMYRAAAVAFIIGGTWLFFS